jgi:ABC-type Fe3+/spermidine/putrescine transport system ATPase subunit
MAAVIALQGVGLSLGGRQILDGVTFSAARGEILALLGPSGSGKSSALRLVLGFAAPTTGQVQIEGDVVSRAGIVLVPPEERRLGVVFQDLALWPHLTVEKHLDFGLASWGIAPRERRTRIDETLTRVGLAGKERRLPAGLSGGERQRVAIARALVLRPRAVLLDEPLASLDVALRQEMLETFRDLFREQAVTALFVTHDLREAERLGARVVVLENGRVVATGTPPEVLADPATPFLRALAADAWKVR